ncbi:alpha/beta hydrolase family protein [Ferrimonas marina]|uniref:Dipeptidyl aminopeptidase/acylaminoacyl peptidase n=1 Tax=Ferrimonas marina TaxID=299255 RepID=A0A1M5VCR0_9GAMM|nr:S9 family peptidase [Ferrimonas marina]SHH73005.1 Dipeptidyl aminopeptidase/acylaminoacyl peptidase [Ferrimonas marina]
MRYLSLVLGLFLSLSLSAAQPGPDSVEYYSKDSQFLDVKVSPDGKHIAVLTPIEGKNALAILNSESLEPTTVARFGDNKEVGDFHWVNKERVIVQLNYYKGWMEQPVSAGEWFGINVNGKKRKNIFGYRMGGMQTGRKIKQATATYGYGQIVDLLPEDKKNILISVTPFSSSDNVLPELHLLNVYTGRMRSKGRSPVPSADFLVDHKGVARFVSGVAANGQVRLYYRDKKDADWALVYEGEPTGENVDYAPLAFADDHQVYIAARGDSPISGVYRMDMKTGERKLVYRDKEVDPSHYWFSADGRHLYALEVEPDYPSYLFIDKQRPETALLKGLIQALPGMQVRLSHQSFDGRFAIVNAFSDTVPGVFYLFDAEKNSLKQVARARPWVETAKSATVKPISFEARDGLTIRGYLTLPEGKEAKNLPLIVNPHGGPHGPRDWWQYDTTTQFLASRGYAVLQVNFRGSGGFGSDFERAGYRHWGDKIQYDIIDATRHVVEQGYADKQRICLYGGSFGGYSALQSAILEPDLFACSLGFVGVYDLEMMYTEGDIPEHESGMRYLNRVIGQDKAQLQAFSPVHNIDKLKAPVFIIHGGQDERAPIEQAEALRKALEAANHPYRWKVMKKEGHGFYNDENRKVLFEDIAGFFDEHLKL